jgi:predicted amidophosphoribosyltransferase
MPKRKQKSYSWAYRARHLQRGLCGFCPRKAEPGKTLCRMHRKKFVADQRRYQADRIAQGRCRVCGDPLCESDKRFHVCGDCQAKSMHRDKMRL